MEISKSHEDKIVEAIDRNTEAVNSLRKIANSTRRRCGGRIISARCQ